MANDPNKNVLDYEGLSAYDEKIKSKMSSDIATETTRATNAENTITINLNAEIERAKAEEAKKAPLASPTLTGTPKAPTASAGTNTTQIATTAFTTKAVSNHNASTTAHSDIRDLINNLTTRLNTLADSDDTTLDQMSEIVAYIKSNKSLIEDITTSKVSVSDIVDNLTSTSTSKVLSANQGKVLKDLIDDLTSVVDGKVDKISGKGLSTNDYTTTEKNKLSGIAAGAEVNQNAFSNIKIGDTTISADSKTDTLELVAGTNVTITQDATNDKITISSTNTDTKVTQTNTTASADYRVALTVNANDNTETTTLRKSANFTANPSTGAFYAKGYTRIDITGQTLDINTLNLSSGSPHIMRYIEKTDGGCANITNVPVTNKPFILDVELVRYVSTTDYVTKQTFISYGDTSHEYVRWCLSGTWGTWHKRVFTDTTYTLSSFGITATATELNYTDGVTSNIQTQLNGKAPTTHNHSANNITSGTLPISRGGTGQTTALGANYSLLNNMTETEVAITDNLYLACVYGTPDATKGAIFKKKASLVWDYIKGKSDTTYVPLTGSTKIIGTLRSTQEIQSTSANGFRIAHGSYGFLIRNDGSHTYFLLTNSGDQYGNWNDLRPLYIHNATGLVKFNNGLEGNLTGNASSATKLTSSAGSATQPVYFSDGKPVACTYTLGKSVPNNAVFTDTVYTHPTTSGNKHIPSGGSSGQILKWSADGTAAWTNDNNTDTKVTQSAIVSADYTNWRPIIWGSSNSATEGFAPATVTNSVFSSDSLTVQPSTGTIRASNYKFGSNATITYDTTNRCLNFNFV